MNVGAALLPGTLEGDVEQAIDSSTPEWKRFVNRNLDANDEHPLAVKYVPSTRAPMYRANNRGLYIGSSNFTWGRGVYVTGIEEPLSTAIYGRVGIVSWFNPVNWRAFDARVPANVDLYLLWLRTQLKYPDAVLTVHSNHWLHEFRNTFREQFQIDVVLFHPDEADRFGWYTAATDTWLAVSDWKGPRELMEKDYSLHFQQARLTIVAEEEFIADDPALTRSPQFALSGLAPITPTNLRRAYSLGQFVRVES